MTDDQQLVDNLLYEVMHKKFKSALIVEDEQYIEQVMQYINPSESRNASIFPIMKHI